MRKHVVFFQGGGGQEDYDADAKLVASLKFNTGINLCGSLSPLI